MRSLIIRRLVFVLLLIVAYLGSLQWERQRAEVVINQLVSGTLQETEYDIRWVNHGVSEADSTQLLQDSQIIGSEAEVFYGQLYYLRSPTGQKVVVAIYPGLFWPTALTFRITDF